VTGMEGGVPEVFVGRLATAEITKTAVNAATELAYLMKRNAVWRCNVAGVGGGERIGTDIIIIM